MLVATLNIRFEGSYPVAILDHDAALRLETVTYKGAVYHLQGTWYQPEWGDENTAICDVADQPDLFIELHEVPVIK